MWIEATPSHLASPKLTQRKKDKMKLTIVLNCDNAAFEKAPGTDTEAARILANFAQSMSYAVIEPDKGNLRDVNGNKVGSWEITED